MEINLQPGLFETARREVRIEMAKSFQSRVEKLDQIWFDLTERFSFMGSKNAFYRSEYWLFLNNFHTRIPRTEDPLDSYCGEITKAIGWLDILNKENLKLSPENSKHYSDLYLGQTPREFFNVVDEVVKSHAFEGGTFRKTFGAERKSALAFPIYVHLRAIGYSDYELTE